MTPNPRVCPMLSYQDAAGAIEFLCKSYGFRELHRLEVGYEGVRIMLASEYPEMGICSPRDLDTRYSQLLVYVDDVDAHHARARAAGAVITAEPTNAHGDRSYRTEDLEGHRWIFATDLEDEGA